MKEAIKIERLKAKDYGNFFPFAKRMLLREFVDYPPRVRRLHLRRFFERTGLEKDLKSGWDVILVAKVEGKVAGFLYLGYNFGGGAQLIWLGVTKSSRQKGIGTTLLGRAEKLVLARKCHFLYLYTESKRNVRFYKKRGYHLAGSLKSAWYGMDEFLMKKDLHHPFPEIFKL